MGNMTTIAVFVVILHVLMWFSTIAMADLNPTGTACYNVAGTIIGNKVSGVGNATIFSSNPITDLPTAETTVTSSSGSFFTDVFLWLLNWLKSVPGLNYIIGFVTAPITILTCMSLPSQFIAGISVLWYLVSFVVLISWIFGRAD